MTLLTTERLVLREFCEADWEAVHEYGRDPQVVRYMTWGPNSEEESRSFVARAIASQHEDPRRHYQFAVVLQAENRVIGGASLNVSSPANREVWIGYCFNRRFWGNGYATEAAEALLAFGFGDLGLHRIFARCDPDNVASARVLEKIGMRREGRLRQHQWVRGKWRDSYVYAVLEDEWGPAATP